jgi:hypothetical protein
VLSCPPPSFPSKTWFFGIYLNFQWQKSLNNSISPTIWVQILPNKIPLNPAHQDLSNNTKGTFQFLRNFQLLFNLVFREKIIQYSRFFAPQTQMSWNQAHAPLLVESFPKTPRTRSEASWFSGSRSYKTKQITFLLHRVNQPVIEHLSAQGRPNPRRGLCSF